MNTIVTLKSFGDFLIPLEILSRLNTEISGISPPNIIAGGHTKVLFEALALNKIEVNFILNSYSNDVPAIYNIRKSNPLSILQSFYEIKKYLLKIDNKKIIIIDKIGYREKLLFFKKSLISLSGCNQGNIYIDYEDKLKSLGYDFLQNQKIGFKSFTTLSVYPGSRVKAKVIPPRIVMEVCRIANEKGLNSKVILFEGDDFTPYKNVNYKIINKNFTSLVQAVRESDLIISADSLPAHLSEFYGIPIFVISPIKNKYWLPKSSFLNNHYCLFNDLNHIHGWIDGLKLIQAIS